MIVGGVIGFHLIMRMQMIITIVTGVLTVVYILLVARTTSTSGRSRRCPRATPRT